MTAMRPRSLAALMVTAVLAVLGMAAVLAHPAAAIIPGSTGVSCFQDGCDLQDPAATGCDADAVTLGRAAIANLGCVELRWSPTCQTNWARVTSTSGVSSATHVLGVEIERKSDGLFEYLNTEGIFESGTYHQGGGGNDGTVYHGVTSLYSDMVYSPGPAKAIGTIDGATVGYGQF